MKAKSAFPAVGALTHSLLLLASALAVPLVFINSGFIAGVFKSGLQLSVSPELSGGSVLAQFSHPLDADNGQGGYEYPLGSGLEKGELNITNYEVRTPLARPSMAGSGEAFWQLELCFAKAAGTGMSGGGFRGPAVHIYISFGSSAAGSTDTAFGEGEMLRFDPAYPWNYVISADGWSSSATILSADSSYKREVQTSWDLKNRRLTLRVNLADAPRLLASVLNGRESWHYVLVGAYDAAREGHFAAVKKEANLHDGGGARDELSPWVYSLITPRGTTQSAELCSENARLGLLAQAEPVAVGAKDRVSAPDRAPLEAAASADAAREEATKKAAIAALPLGLDSDKAGLEQLFSLGLEDRAMQSAKARLADNSKDYLALAYHGALVAREASRASSVSDKLRLVNAAYLDLDQAAAKANELDPKLQISILFCRASVSLAVPNDVFNRAAQAAADFEALRKLFQDSGETDRVNYCLEKAALAYEAAGRDDEAKVRWATLAEQPSASLAARVRLELLDRGF